MKRGLVQAWARLFMVQASWNHDRLQGVGTAYAAEPLLRDLPGGREGERYRAAMARAASFFNAHPYFLGLAVGAIARAEHQEMPPEQIERLRMTLPSPLGSLGDRLVWAGVLPATAGLGLSYAATLPWLAGPAVFLVLYNVVHLFVRTWALLAGWRFGIQVGHALSQPWLRRSLRVAPALAALAVGFALPLVGQRLGEGLSGIGRTGVILVALAGVLLGRWVAPSVSGLKFGLAAVSLALFVGWLWQSSSAWSASSTSSACTPAPRPSS
jgi:mannose/fructose/N-acetylgalactosamine-specific phosphotransferase system component IID